MATIADLQAEVAALTTVEDGVVALLNGVSAQLREALATGATQTSIQAVIDSLDAGKAKLAAAVVANTPVSPPVVPPVTPVVPPVPPAPVPPA